MEVNRIRLFRTMRGWSQAELGRRAEVPQVDVSDIELGRRPKAGQLEALARAFDVERPESLLAPASAEEVEVAIKVAMTLLADPKALLETAEEEDVLVSPDVARYAKERHGVTLRTLSVHGVPDPPDMTKRIRAARRKEGRK